MANQKDLEDYYIQNLENDIIKYLAGRLKIDNREAMDIYYKS